MSTLEQDVRTLQSQVRRQRRWNIALGAVVVVGGLMAAVGFGPMSQKQEPKKTFEVQEVKEAKGISVDIQRGQLKATSNGQVLFRAVVNSTRDASILFYGSPANRNVNGNLLLPRTIAVESGRTEAVNFTQMRDRENSNLREFWHLVDVKKGETEVWIPQQEWMLNVIPLEVLRIKTGS
jgi:hypothetical protein